MYPVVFPLLPLPRVRSMLHPCPLQRQGVEILAYVDGLPTTQVRCPPLELKIYRSTTRHRHVGALNVGCFSFQFQFLYDRRCRCRCRCRASLRTRAQVQTERAKSPFNSRTSPHPKEKISEQSIITMCKMAYTYLRSLEDAPASTVIVVMVVWASDCYSAPQTSTFNSPGSRGRRHARPLTNTAFPTMSPYYGQDSMDIASKRGRYVHI